jgi:hypothetical protein
VVIYKFDKSLSSELRSGVEEAARIWNAAGTGFVIRPLDPGTDSSGPKLVIYDANLSKNPAKDTFGVDEMFCRAGVPRAGNPVTMMWLNRKCLGAPGSPDRVGSIVHEFIHVFGMLHEHQRPDRGLYLTLATITKNDDDLRVLERDQVTFPLTGPYDPCSITHYGLARLGPGAALTATGADALKTCLRPLPDAAVCQKLGQRCVLTAGDIAAAHSLVLAEREMRRRNSLRSVEGTSGRLAVYRVETRRP